VHPAEGDHPWVLCEDDRLLLAKGLPPYSTSLHRYLYVKEAGEETGFVAVTPNAPESAQTLLRPLEEVLGGQKTLAPLNPGGGLMLVRTYSPLGYETFVDLVGGAPAEGLAHGR